MLYKAVTSSVPAVFLMVLCTGAWALSIPAKELESKRIYVGNPQNFSTPAEVDYSAVVHKTPEYQEIVDEKLERGSGKYWILLQQASDKALNAISKTAEKSEYDLIAEKGYLGSLAEPISCPDITSSVIQKLD